jgi:hypothetical protein
MAVMGQKAHFEADAAVIGIASDANILRLESVNQGRLGT